MRTALSLLGLSLLTGCVVTSSVESADYATATAWRGWNKTEVPAGWVFEGDVIHLAEPGAGDLITRAMFEDFVLELSWKISPGGNSGVFFHATEEGGAIYHSAPEIQILDDAANPGASMLNKSGANYALHPTREEAFRPQGEWNDLRVTVDDGVVTHEQNGVELFSYELGSPEWEELVANSKFAAWPIYGRAGTGHVGLQDHGNEVWFRDVRSGEPTGDEPLRIVPLLD